MGIALVFTVGDGPVREKRGKDTTDRKLDFIEAGDVKKGLLLPGEGGIRQVFCSRGGTHGPAHVLAVVLLELGVGMIDGQLQFCGQWHVHDPAPDLPAGCREIGNVVDIERIESCIDPVTEAFMCQKFAVGMGRRGKSPGYLHTEARQVSDHLSE